jgi:hypothetical protein
MSDLQVGKWLSNPGNSDERPSTQTGVGKYLSVPAAKPAAGKPAAAAAAAAAATAAAAAGQPAKAARKVPAGQSTFGNFDSW